MPEVEELKLVVSLDDQASVGLEKVKTALQQIGGGEMAENAQRLRRHTQEMTLSFRSFREEIERMGRAVPIIGPGLASIATGILGVVTASLGLAGIKNFADEMERLDRLSKTTGFGAGMIKGVIDQLERLGIDRGAAAQNIQGIADSLQNLSLASS